MVGRETILLLVIRCIHCTTHIIDCCRSPTDQQSSERLLFPVAIDYDFATQIILLCHP